MGRHYLGWLEGRYSLERKGNISFHLGALVAKQSMYGFEIGGSDRG